MLKTLITIAAGAVAAVPILAAVALIYEAATAEKWAEIEQIEKDRKNHD